MMEKADFVRLRCDGCKEFLTEKGLLGIEFCLSLAYKRGWIHVLDPSPVNRKDKDLCPKCQKEEKT